MSSNTPFESDLLQAWQGSMPLLTLIDRASALEAGQQPALAAILYQTWLNADPPANAHLVEFNLGSVLYKLDRIPRAEAAYLRAIAQAPRFIHPRLNLGLLYERLGRLDDAVAQWQDIVQWPLTEEANRDTLVMAFNHLGRVLELQKRYDQALAALQGSLDLQPEQPDVLHHWVFLRQRVCAWPVYAQVPGVSADLMRNSTSALAMLSISDDPADQLQAARHYVDKNLLKNLPRLAPTTPYGHTRLRIGYLSSDFCLHPVAMLMVELMEQHDRTHFEVHGFCWTRDDGSPLRARVIAACDQFHRIDALNDQQAAEKMRALEMDILIDLQGQTAGARPNILEYRPAPVQVTYLGLPATTGLPGIDHVIADRFLIPAEQASHYSEQPLYMPDVYMVSDRKRVSSAAPSRAACGLPATGTVFCSFNNSFKYTPEMFAAWMRILRAVPDSVLWLLADNVWAENNLRAEATAAGLAPERLVFATRTAPEQYLARYAVADLFLDTFPFNAGTTANDCLWMGCPIVTLTGRSFAARMAGALLTAAGLPELITQSVDDYVALAVALARDPARRQALRMQLEGVRSSGALFDTTRFARNLEQALTELAAAER